MDINQLKFAKTHEWVSPEGKVGISEHAQKEITDVVFVELPTSGRAVSKGSEAGTIESVKAAFPIYSPVSGSVVKVNEEVARDPQLVNQSPYEKGWMYQIEMSDGKELDLLMTHDQYQDFLRSEVAHH